MADMQAQLVIDLQADAAIQTHCGAGSAARIYPQELPKNPTLPAITYGQVGGAEVQSLGGSNALGNPQLQVDCWGETYAAARVLAKEVKRVLNAASATGYVILNEFDAFEYRPRQWRATLDFSVWHTNS